MNVKRRKTWRKAVLVLMVLILLFFAFELIFQRHKMLHSLAGALYSHNKFSLPERIWNWLADPADKDDIPENSLARLNYKAGDHSSAKEGFSRAASENDANPANLYNRGNTEYRMNDLDSALQDFKDAMLADPKDKDAKSNYELVLMRKGYKPPKQQQGDKDDQSPDKDNNQQDQENQKQNEEDGKQKYNSILDALDQKEARDRSRGNDNNPQPGSKWW